MSSGRPNRHGPALVFSPSRSLIRAWLASRLASLANRGQCELKTSLSHGGPSVGLRGRRAALQPCRPRPLA